MYEGHFKLRGRPFLAAPMASRYFPGMVIEAARQTLLRTIERGEGPALVIGPPGSGKSMLCHVLCEELRHRFAVAHLVNGRFASRSGFLQAILYELDVPCRGLDEGELRLALLDYLDPVAGATEGLLLVLDEAHTLPWRLLEEVRMLTNLVRDGKPRVRAVLAGDTVLEERFANPRLGSFNQRLAARCYLGPLNATETAAYVKSQIAAVGGAVSEVVDETALAAIYRATDGTPRLINQIANHAMILACLGGKMRLDAAAIDEAWADLQQLPPPWKGAAAAGNASAPCVVEFGTLDEIGEMPFDAIPFSTATRHDPPTAAMSGVDAGPRGFQPAGASGTEVELDFPEFGDPFAEEFVQEEVLLDVYGGPVDLFATLPRVGSSEGREIGAMLEPCMVERTPPMPAIRLGVRHDEPASAAVTAVRGSTSPVGDRKILVVEDSEFIVRQPHASPGGPTRRPSEFRQLFSKLRRGN